MRNLSNYKKGDKVTYYVENEFNGAGRSIRFPRHKGAPVKPNPNGEKITAKIVCVLHDRMLLDNGEEFFGIAY